MSQNYDNEIMTTAETDDTARLNRLRAAAISRRFKEIDSEKIRCMSDITLEKPDGYGKIKLAELEAEAEQLRAELAGLEV